MSDNHVTIEQCNEDCTFPNGFTVVLPSNVWDSLFRDLITESIPKALRKWAGGGTWYFSVNVQEEMESAIAKRYPKPKYSVEWL